MSNIPALKKCSRLAREQNPLFTNKPLVLIAKKERGLTKARFTISPTILQEVVRRIIHDIERETTRLKNQSGQNVILNNAKKGGICAYWLRKLKPCCVVNLDVDTDLLLCCYFNEVLAIFFGMQQLASDQVKLDADIMNEWAHSYRYHAHSRESSILAFELFLCETSGTSGIGGSFGSANAGRTIEVTVKLKQGNQTNELMTTNKILKGLDELKSILPEENMRKIFYRTGHLFVDNPEGKKPEELFEIAFKHEVESDDSVTEPFRTPEPSPPSSDIINWYEVIGETARYLEEIYRLTIEINREVVRDISELIQEDLYTIQKKRNEKNQKKRNEKNNVQQVAGIAMFWIAKLKPCVSRKEENCKNNNILTVCNELIAILIGLAVMNVQYAVRGEKFSKRFIECFKGRILLDWVKNWHYGLFSRSSCILAVEMIDQFHLKTDRC